MSKLIRKNETLDYQVFSRDLREYVVPVREINKLRTFDEPKEPPADYEDMLKALFNRCYALTAMRGAPEMCFFCVIREACNKFRTVGKKGTEK